MSSEWLATVLVILAGSPRARELGLYSGGLGRRPARFTILANLSSNKGSRLKSWNLALLIFVPTFPKVSVKPQSGFSSGTCKSTEQGCRHPFCWFSESSSPRMNSGVDYFFLLLFFLTKPLQISPLKKLNECLCLLGVYPQGSVCYYCICYSVWNTGTFVCLFLISSHQ